MLASESRIILLFHQNVSICKNLPLLPPQVIFLPSGDHDTVVNESSVECEIFPSNNPVSTFHK